MGRYSALTFDTVETDQDLRHLAGFLGAHPATYDPESYERWIEEKCIPGVSSGEWSALAFWQDGMMVGDAVLRVVGVDTAEIKSFRKTNFTTATGETILGAGRFMMTQALAEARHLLTRHGQIPSDTNDIVVRLDTTEGTPAERFFARFGFEQYDREELYVPGQTEVLMQRRVALNL